MSHMPFQFIKMEGYAAYIFVMIVFLCFARDKYNIYFYVKHDLVFAFLLEK